MIRPTLALFSKASRVPLTSKGGNKEFYKGTGSFPGLGPKRTGRHGYGKAPYLLMPERMRTFVVPEGLNDCELRPYVARSVRVGPQTPAEKEAELEMWGAETRDVGSKRQGLYGPNGFDAAYYLQLAGYVAPEKKVEKKE